ncbi:hypothetical protein CYG50_09720 [Providencia huaxiensis]|nr:hypothetical protein CYG50_09720 [Providencia huaxiensis]
MKTNSWLSGSSIWGHQRKAVALIKTPSKKESSHLDEKKCNIFIKFGLNSTKRTSKVLTPINK